MGPTEADREVAIQVMAEWDTAGGPDELRKLIAQALADERERARAPFLRALGVIDDGYFAPEPYDKGVRWAADRIRRAAEEDA